ncbi:adenosylcobinamide-GDP ribazoletransferase [Caldimonas brevitalea]|uniref:Adenosylcobinamide-GDP ribazoletransferase n=1 Tax=Caldimonas brevitalea TaxID=413882 RepID=A0A0G3BPM0_9BURK|nr:adenosylcobinamide-GDP ribazoletransferase [Caldimonas brevitalea]AKJ29933.1 cobalamin synthase [Caldimonas brevitalea]
MRAAAHELRLALIAWQFLTRVPLPGRWLRWMGYRDAWLHASARHFPLVGALVGLYAAAVYAVAALLWPPTVAAGLSMAATLLITGAFHEDGWADVCDGLGGAVSRERALEIMKDSRIGAYGAIGLVMMLGLKWATLAALPWPVAAGALLLAHSASRTAAVSLIRWMAYAGDLAQAKAKPLARQVSMRGWGVALAWTAAAAGASSSWLPLPVVLAAVGAGGLVTLCWALWLQRRLGGYTGDCLGAAQQLCELAVYLVCAATWRWSA